MQVQLIFYANLKGKRMTAKFKHMVVRFGPMLATYICVITCSFWKLSPAQPSFSNQRPKHPVDLHPTNIFPPAIAECTRCWTINVTEKFAYMTRLSTACQPPTLYT